MKLLGIAGRARSGKDTVADLVVKLTDGAYVKIAFADALKRACRDIYNLSHEQCWGRLKEVPDERLAIGSVHTYCLTPRRIFQRFGTEVARQVHPDTWVLAGMSVVDQLAIGPRIIDDADSDDLLFPVYKPEAGIFFVDRFDRRATRTQKLVVFSDVRFANEAQAIRARGGSIWRCHRPGAERQDSHESERELPADLVVEEIDNTRSLEALAAHVHGLLDPS